MIYRPHYRAWSRLESLASDGLLCRMQAIGNYGIPLLPPVPSFFSVSRTIRLELIVLRICVSFGGSEEA